MESIVELRDGYRAIHSGNRQIEKLRNEKLRNRGKCQTIDGYTRD